MKEDHVKLEIPKTIKPKFTEHRKTDQEQIVSKILPVSEIYDPKLYEEMIYHGSIKTWWGMVAVASIFILFAIMW